MYIVFYLLSALYVPLGQLVTSAMINFMRAKVTLNGHVTQTTHKTAAKIVVDFLHHMEKGVLSILQQLLIQSSDTITKNRSIIRSILKTIVFVANRSSHVEERVT